MAFLLFLIAIAWFASEPDSRRPVERDTPAGKSVEDSASDWRHTTKGWQRASSWHIDQASRQFNRLTAVHPIVVGLLVLLICVGALVAFSSPSCPPAPRKSDRKGNR